MGVYKRGKTWWMCLNVNGKQLRATTGTENKSLAQKIYHKTTILITEGKWVEHQKARTTLFREMAEKYMATHAKTRDCYSIRRLLPDFGDLSLSEITTEQLADYRSRRLEKVKPSTVYQELSLIRRMFNVAKREWKWIGHNPVADLSFSIGNSNARDRWLTLEEERRLLDAAERPAWLRTMLTVALHSGMRCGEILALKWQDIDFGRSLLTVLKSKNGEKRGIPLSNSLRATLLHYKQASRLLENISGRVFPITASSVRQSFIKARDKAGLVDFRFHDLRHTFATRLVQAGVDLYRVQKLLGHRSTSMTQRYSHHSPESLRSSIEILDDLSQIYHNRGHLDQAATGQ